MATIRKRIKKNNKVSWQIDYYDPQGKRVMKCFDKKADAEAYLGKVNSTKKEGRYDEVFNFKKEINITFAQLAEKYADNYQTQRSWVVKKYLLGKLIDHFGDKQLSKITFFDLETYRNKLQATPVIGKRTSRIRSGAAVNHEMSLLRHIFSKAKQWEMIEVSPFEKGPRLKVKENSGRLRFLSQDEIERLLSECPPHIEPIVETAIHTGMRRGELLGLKWEQIKHGQIYITESKTDKPRQIPINERLAAILKEQRRKNQMKWAYVFCGPDGKRFTDIKKSFNSARRRAGLEDFRFHDLRHTFASHLVMAGVSLKAVQELLGHTTLTMTLRYSHLAQDHLKTAVESLNSLASGKQTVNICAKVKGS